MGLAIGSEVHYCPAAHCAFLVLTHHTCRKPEFTVSEFTLADLAGEAIESACKSEKQQPVALVVLWAFAFASALVLYREGFAKCASSDEWATHVAAVDQI